MTEENMKAKASSTALYERMGLYDNLISDYRSLVIRIGEVRHKLSEGDANVQEARDEKPKSETVLGIMDFQNEEFKDLNNRLGECLVEIEEII